MTAHLAAYQSLLYLAQRLDTPNAQIFTLIFFVSPMGDDWIYTLHSTPDRKQLIAIVGITNIIIVLCIHQSPRAV